MSDFNYKRYIDERRRRPGKSGRFDIFRDDFQHLHRDEVLLCSHLVNIGQALADEAGWFWANAKHVESGTGLDADTADRVLERLQRRKIVEVEHRRDEDGRRGKRYVRVNLDRLGDALAGKLPAKSGFGLATTGGR